eukprot:12871182-Alexandrium_andersonii.AAC.1
MVLGQVLAAVRAEDFLQQLEVIRHGRRQAQVVVAEERLDQRCQGRHWRDGEGRHLRRARESCLILAADPDRPPQTAPDRPRTKRIPNSDLSRLATRQAQGART